MSRKISDGRIRKERVSLNQPLINYYTEFPPTDPGEIGGDMVFPHLYNGGQLGSGEVENVFTLLKGEGNWEVQEIQKAEWLIY